MNVAHSQPAVAHNSSPARSLRDALEARSALGQVLPLETAVAQLIPLCIEVGELHAQGYGCYLHPSNVRESADGHFELIRERATDLPHHPKDQACMPPETSSHQLNDARAHVYSLGAILYELVTGQTVGHGMRRPSDILPTLPQALESILTAALITDPEKRPDDLGQLAQSLHQLVKPGTVPPPAPHISISPSSPQINIDVSMSLLPPVPSARPPAGPVNAYGVAVQSAAPASTRQAQAAAEPPRLGELKAQLEGDPRPRYFVVKQGMDHGPFTAVELAHHISNHTFDENDQIVDNVENRTAEVREYVQFAPFADHAKRQRNLKERQATIVQVEAAEKKSTRGKALAGLIAVGLLLVAGGAWYLTQRGERSDEVAIATDEATNVETDESLGVRKKRSRGKRRSRSAGNVPKITGGKSCEAAQNAYNEQMVVGQKGQADITAGQYGRILNSGAYFSHCGVPMSMDVRICAAVQNGRAVGVTVTTNPPNAKKRSCIAQSVRNLTFPSHPKLDVTRTHFKAQ